MTSFPDTGKVQQEFLKTFIYPAKGAERKEVLIGPEFGVDNSLVRLPNGLALISTSDPLSLIPSLGLRESAWLSVHLAASDLATSGFAPQYAQVVLNLPPTLQVKDFSEYWNHIDGFCKELGVAITGGHTGRFEGQNSTVAGGITLMAVVPEKEVITSKGGRGGDAIILTKEASLISTAILAMSFPETIERECGSKVLREAESFFYQSSTVKDALVAVKNGKNWNSITAMHDVTECGVLGAIYELATASDRGVFVEADKIPVGEAQVKICGLFNIDPLYSVGAGALLITSPPEKAPEIIKKLNNEGIRATVIGKLTNKKEGLNMMRNNITDPLAHPGEDPYWKAFYQAFQKKWR